ncbi:N-acetylmuramoyl-L-alanine amidase [Bacillus sp. SKDU12]|nr:N-acetylmuramoyl-L-alanine amidase [Bacillus sp. SKDU12]
MNSSASDAAKQHCRALHFYPDKKAENFGIDSYYGPKIANAVRRFQSRCGLSADGIYDPKTKVKIEAELK